jgi:aryl-alcohol dehydrogenase-like predicted oxidoreductase
MKLVRFGKTGLQVSPLGFGGAQIGYLDTDRQIVGKMLNFLLDQGANVIDTASSYETSEEVIGESISHRRAEFVLISKCGNPIPGLSGRRWSAELISQTIDRSLRLLKTDRLDAMLLHSCDLATLHAGEAMGALVKARAAGKIRHAGYSGDNEAAAFAAGLPDVAVIETSISLADQANIDMVLPIALKNDLAVIAKRPIANAAWKNPAEHAGLYKEYARSYTDRLSKMKLNPGDLGIPGEPQTAWPELALRFTLSHPGIHTAIIGTTNQTNARANFAYAEKGPLPAHVLQKIRDAFKTAQGKQHWPGLQ